MRINLWSMHNNTTTFNVVDAKPDDMEELSEVTTSRLLPQVTGHKIQDTSVK